MQKNTIFYVWWPADLPIDPGVINLEQLGEIISSNYTLYEYKCILNVCILNVY